MNNYIDAAALRQEVSLVELLRRLGHQPVIKSGGELKYHSPIRARERVPSFTVNPLTGQWYDPGLPGGGDLISFAVNYWPALSFYQVLKKIKEVCSLPEGKLQFARKKPRTRKAEKVVEYELFALRPLGSNPLLEEYLQSQRVWQAAQGRLSEVYIRCNTGSRTGSKLFGLGWQNEYFGWEIHTCAQWKHCLGQKGISRFKGDPKRVVLFGEMMDYLSWLVKNPKDKSSVLVLNCLDMIGYSIKVAAEFEQKTCFFANTTPGQAATLTFLNAYPAAIDGSAIYQVYQSYHEMLITEPAELLPWKEEGIFQQVLKTYQF